jgi:hypothetical protein
VNAQLADDGQQHVGFLSVEAGSRGHEVNSSARASSVASSTSYLDEVERAALSDDRVLGTPCRNRRSPSSRSKGTRLR